MGPADFSQLSCHLPAGSRQELRASLPFCPRKVGGSQTDFAANVHLPKAAGKAKALTKYRDHNPASAQGGRAGVYMTHHPWNAVFGTMPEPFLKCCVTYQLPRANQHGIHHLKRRQHQRAPGE